MKKQMVIGILAHVDAGKTTLSEAVLYNTGSIRNMGRVDHKDAFLDTHELERARGITIFSKQAVFVLEDKYITLLDTPGHVDFCAEMERTLWVLDYAVLVISGADGIQGHTLTLWGLLKKYGIPAFIYINKMDQEGTNREELLKQMQQRLSEGCLDFSQRDSESFLESAAMCDEEALESYLETGRIREEELKRMIGERKLFPCYFGSALKNEGVLEFLQGLSRYTVPPVYPENFGARVFKIARDEQNNRLTYLKITGGSLKVREQIEGEKANQLRIYSGNKYETVEAVEAGGICAVAGWNKTQPGIGMGRETGIRNPVLVPVLTYGLILPEGTDPAVLLPKLRQLEEEEPQLHLVWQEALQEIQIQVMGAVQLETLKSLIDKRCSTKVEFGPGQLVYKETIIGRVEGVGHFEPLRHYAEVHLILEAGERGSGLQFFSDCREELLARNWQRLILTHLQEKKHLGVLTGSPLTDMKITLTGGRAHQKHTEGGDFREACWRAVRQGLMEAESVLLEPWYEIRLEIPENQVGRAMADVERMHGTWKLPESAGDSVSGDGLVVLEGTLPAAALGGYQQEVAAYTRGQGRFYCRVKGYEICHNPEEIIAKTGYDAERDTQNPAGSVFCAHGAGFVVSWDKVKNFMHVESCLKKEANEEAAETEALIGFRAAQRQQSGERWVGTEEIDHILERATHANQRKPENSRKGVVRKEVKRQEAETLEQKRIDSPRPKPEEEYLLVDGYNVIFAWEELRELARRSLDGARGRLLDILCNYQAVKKCRLIAVFDAYRVEGHRTEILDYHNIHVVYTREAETADRYIEKFAHENGRRYRITVATSDALEQVIIQGQGCMLLSARELEEEIRREGVQNLESYQEGQQTGRSYMLDHLSEEEIMEIREVSENNKRKTDN